MQHATASIRVQSIETTAERTEFEGHRGSRDVGHLPRQFHVSNLPDGALDLGPGQVAIVPITFLPRFPSESFVDEYEEATESSTLQDDDDGDVLSEDGTGSTPPQSPPPRLTLSKFQEADRLDVLEYSGSEWSQATAVRRNRNNLEHVSSPPPRSYHVDQDRWPKHTVSATILVETDRGDTIELPLEASSIRRNSFGLPDAIHFDMHQEKPELEPVVVKSGIDGKRIFDEIKARMRNQLENQGSPTEIQKPIIQSRTLLVPNGTTFQLNEEGGVTILETGSGQMATISTDEIGLDMPRGTTFIVSDNGSIEVASGNDEKNDDTFVLSDGAMGDDALHSDDYSDAWIVDRKVQPLDVFSSASTHTPGEDCYDIYLRNPVLSTELSVTEVAVSDPFHTSLLVNGELAVESSPQQVIRKWKTAGRVFADDLEGAFMISAGDSSSHYLVTVCATDLKNSSSLAPSASVMSEFESGSSPDSPFEWFDYNSLGFLQIKSNYDTFIVSLWRADEEVGEGSRRVHDFRPPILQEESSGLERNNTASDNRNTSFRSADQKIHTSLDSIDLHFLSSSHSNVAASLDLTNFSPRPIVMMRVAVALETLELNRTLSARTLFGGSGVQSALLKEMGIDLHLLTLSDPSLWSPIAPGQTVDSAVTLNCSIDWEKFTEYSPDERTVEVRGAVVLRASTEVDLSFVEWKKSLRAGDSVDTDVVVEVPLRIAVTRGRIAFLIQETTYALPQFWPMERYSDDYDVAVGGFFPLHEKIVEVQLNEKEKEKLGPQYKRGVDNQFRVFNDLNVDMVVDTVEVVGGSIEHTPDPSLCDRFDAYVVERGESEYIDLGGGVLMDMGLVLVRYRFPPKENPNREVYSRRVLPSMCYFRMETEPPSGTTELPFLVYTGRLHISGERSSSEATDQASGARADYEEPDGTWQETVVGFSNLVEWFQSTKAGFALHSVLKASMERGNNSNRDGALLGRYLYGLAGRSMDLETANLNPVLLKIGAIAAGDTETLPLYLTNYNPMPVTITIDVGEVEGMSIAIGRDESTGKGGGVSILDTLPLKPEGSGRDGRGKASFYGHPLNGLREFLRKNEIARGFFDRFPFRDDISMDHSILKRFPVFAKRYSYREDSVASFHKSRLPGYLARGRSTLCDTSAQPSLYGRFQKKLELSGKKRLGPVIISSDRKMARRLTVCGDTDRESEVGTHVVIPPGGVARFDVSLRSLPNTALEKDITQFTATGLVISTSFGEILPIVVSFEALQGKLQLSSLPAIEQHCNNCTQHERDGVVQVPVRLFERSVVEDLASSIRIPPHTVRSFAEIARLAIVPRNVSLGESGVSLFMKSSFLRNIQLRKVVSCNPLFRISLVNETSDAEVDPFLGVFIGSIISAVSCDDVRGTPPNASRFPSVFRCASSWLTRRAELQPRGCGSPPSRDVRLSLNKNSETGEPGGIDKLIKSLKRATIVSEWSDELFSNSSIEHLYSADISTPIKSGRREEGGLVSPMMIGTVAGAWTALQTAADAGFLSLRTELRAIVEYNATPEEISPVKRDASGYEESSHLLSVAFRNISVESTLEIPTLLSTTESQNTSTSIGDWNFDSVQVVDFEPTLVANVNVRSILVRNPTSVPVRVRLAAAPLISVDNVDLRTSYLGNLPSPYVQSRRSVPLSPREYAHHQWWDRGGSFFHPDFEGDMIRSHYNITIKSGIGGRISLVNPSFLGSVAFLVGCGSRCGLRQENKMKKNFESLVNLTPTSPIGASAAAGRNLVGKPRSALPSQENQLGSEEMTLAAGGSLISDGSGPAAFAIPYSALDEMIIPPFSEAEMGPVFFRPPGRSNTLGSASLKGTVGNDLYSSQVFESLLFLENSLTGLERVVLRGKALWEKVVFLDPNPDGFGDIEQRNGRSTLVFPGTRERTPNESPLPVLREVVVHNDGDVAVTIARGYLTHTPKPHRIAPLELSSSVCELSRFRLLGCRDASGIPSFHLLPGENRSLFVEHYPECTKKKEYISLNIEIEGQSNGHSRDAGVFGGFFGSHSQFQEKANTNMRAELLRKQKMELLVGYEMSDKMFASCFPVARPPSGYDEEVAIIDDIISGNATYASVSLQKRLASARKSSSFNLGLRAMGNGIWILVALCAVIVSTTRLLRRLLSFRKDAKTLQKNSSNAEKNWTATFRCLARADPTSSDLQSLGREQTRQIVLARLRAQGAMPPQCFSSTGVAKRERPNAGAAASRQAISGTANGAAASSNERIRKSEALFGKVCPIIGTGKGHLPLQLGWRSALSRGIIDASSLTESPMVLKTDELLLRRKSLKEAIEVSPSDGGGVVDGSESFNNDSSSSFGSSIDEESEGGDSNDSHVTPTSVPKSISTASGTANGNDTNETARVTPTRYADVESANASPSGKARTAEGLSKASVDPVLAVQPPSVVRESLPQSEDTKGEISASAAVVSSGANGSKKKGLPLKKLASQKVVEGAGEQPSADDASDRKTKQQTTKPNREKTKDVGDKKANEKPSSEGEEKKQTRKKKQPSKSTKAKKGKARSGKASTEASSPRPSPTSEKEKVASSTPPSSDRPRPSGSPLLRPPPGLLPPPGFDGGFTTALDQTALSGEPLSISSPPPTGNSDTDLINTSTPPVVSRSISDTSDSVGEAFLRAIHSESPVTGVSEGPPSPTRPMSSLDELQPDSDNRRSVADFDVMDFLDGILEEGSGVSADAEGATVGGGFLPSAQGSGASGGSGGGGDDHHPQSIPSNVMPISANPWATNSSETLEASRAAAYGIAFEDAGGDRPPPQQQHQQVTAATLLTPANIFATNAADGGWWWRRNQEERFFLRQLVERIRITDS